MDFLDFMEDLAKAGRDIVIFLAAVFALAAVAAAYL
jgi:hypothetical protein